MVEISYESEWLSVKLYLELKNAHLGNRVWQNPNFPGTHRQFKDVSRFSRTTHERRSAGFPGRAWTVSNIKLSGREWIVSIYDESTLHNYEISCNDVCEVPSWPQRARQQTHHSYAAGLLGTEQRARYFLKDQREPATRPWECSWSRSTAAIWSATLEPSSHRPLTLSLSLPRLAAWNLRKPEIHVSIPSLKNLAGAEIKIQDQHAKYWVTLLPVAVVVYATTFNFD